MPTLSTPACLKSRTKPLTLYPLFYMCCSSHYYQDISVSVKCVWIYLFKTTKRNKTTTTTNQKISTFFRLIIQLQSKVSKSRNQNVDVDEVVALHARRAARQAFVWRSSHSDLIGRRSDCGVGVVVTEDRVRAQQRVLGAGKLVVVAAVACGRRATRQEWECWRAISHCFWQSYLLIFTSYEREREELCLA